MEALAPDLWKRTHTSMGWCLRTVSQQRVTQMLAETTISRNLGPTQECAADTRRRRPRGSSRPIRTRPCAVAYFSMEFMLSEALPIYSGGLGNVAGDQLKSASNLGVPVVGVGLLYQQGYFRQEFDCGGAQQALYPFNDPGQLPIRPLREAERRMAAARDSRSRATASGFAPGRCRSAACRSTCWTPTTRRITPAHRGITSELYGGDAELRLKQEIVLGIGGWRLLRALGLRARGLPSERRARRVCRAGARALHTWPTSAAVRRRADRDAGGQSVHDPHRRSKPASTGSRPT